MAGHVRGHVHHGAHAALAAGLAPGATYRHRAALAYEGGETYGEEREFQTLHVYTVQISVQPPSGGIVGGGGPYTYGATVTATATLSAGYRFANWTEEGSEVWAAPSCTFAVTADRDLVANFVLVGDANLDGILDARDVRITHQAALGLVGLSPTQRLAADVDSDGAITGADAEMVAAWIIGCP